MSQDTLFDKVWDLLKVSSLPGGSDQIFIGLHLIHEVTSPQAFGALKDKNLKVKFPDRTVATVIILCQQTIRAGLSKIISLNR